MPRAGSFPILTGTAAPPARPRTLPLPVRNELTMTRYRSVALIAAVVGLSLAFPPRTAAGQEAGGFDLLITGGRVIDGTGNPWHGADVGIRDGRIAAVGDLAGARADRVIDATGKWVTPGFIDLHSHAGDRPPPDADRPDESLTSPEPRRRAAPNLVSQGATTLVVNQDGRSPWPIRNQRRAMAERGIGPNAILMVGHGTLRSRVMGEDFRRTATDGEVRRMQDLLRQGMEEGAYGMSAGHEYSPMRWSDTDEVARLVQEVKPYGGFYIVHERSSGAQPMWWWPSEDDPGAPTMLDAVVETIEVAERTGVPSVQTHIKAKGAHFWGSSHAIVLLIERARERGVRVWADQYPYNTTGSDGSTVLLPPRVRRAARDEAAEGAEPDYAATLRRMLEHPDTAAMIREDMRHEMYRRGGPENLLVLAHPDSSLVGRTLRELAEERGVEPLRMGILLQLEGDPNRPGGARMRGFSLSEYDVRTFAAEPWVATASDAGIALPGDGFVHPRYYGTFPRKIRKYAMEEGVLSVEDAIRSMTSLPAQILGLGDRGLLREGYRADVAVLDPERIRDTAEPLEPHQYAEGVDYVLVNGELLVDGGELTWALPGMVITPERPGVRAGAPNGGR